MKPFITEEMKKEIFSVLKPKENEEDDAYTFTEIKDILGYGDDKARNAIRELHRLGMIEVVKVTRQTIVGNYTQVPAYRLKLEAK